MPRRSFLDLLAPLLFAAGLLVVAFGGGFFVGTHRLFPHDQLAGATDALYGAYKAYLRPPPFNRPAAAEAVDGSRALDPQKSRQASPSSSVTAATVSAPG